MWGKFDIDVFLTTREKLKNKLDTVECIENDDSCPISDTIMDSETRATNRSRLYLCHHFPHKSENARRYFKEDNGNISVSQQLFMWLPLHLNDSVLSWHIDT